MLSWMKNKVMASSNNETASTSSSEAGFDGDEDILACGKDELSLSSQRTNEEENKPSSMEEEKTSMEASTRQEKKSDLPVETVQQEDETNEDQDTDLPQDQDTREKDKETSEDQDKELLKSHFREKEKEAPKRGKKRRKQMKLPTNNMNKPKRMTRSNLDLTNNVFQYANDGSIKITNKIDDDDESLSDLDNNTLSDDEDFTTNLKQQEDDDDDSDDSVVDNGCELCLGRQCRCKKYSKRTASASKKSKVAFSTSAKATKSKASSSKTGGNHKKKIERRRTMNKTTESNTKMPRVPVEILLHEDSTSWNIFTSNGDHDEDRKLVDMKKVKLLYPLWSDFITNNMKDHENQEELLTILEAAYDEQLQYHQEFKVRAGHIQKKKENVKRKKTDPPLTISHIKDRTARSKCENVLTNVHELQVLTTFANSDLRKQYEETTTDHFMFTIDTLERTVHNNSGYKRKEPVAVVLASPVYDSQAVGEMMIEVGKALKEGSNQAVCTDSIEDYHQVLFGNKPSLQFKATIETKKKEREKLEREELKRQKQQRK